MFKIQTIVLKLVLSLLIILTHVKASPSDTTNFKWQLNEELTYKVTYAFINLGKIKINIVDTVRIDSQKTYKIKMRIDSNPLLFWVNMHSDFDAFIDEDFRPIQLITNENINGTNYKGTFRFNYHTKTITMNYRSTRDSTETIKKIIPFEDPIYDGITMIFFARQHIIDHESITIDAMVEDKKGPVIFNFTGEEESIHLDALDRDVDCYYLFGEFKIKGIAGVTGPYEGWFSKDAQRVPVYAKMKVFIGSVKLELDGWKNWHIVPDKE